MNVKYPVLFLLFYNLYSYILVQQFYNENPVALTQFLNSQRMVEKFDISSPQNLPNVHTVTCLHGL
jgi:hypothetical protein